eukprot:CAMPEP_0113648534 /NCGR_PEP_ID=MMETSP0017_2-20120614/25749_1 /TAXON_ID=2856 /ORGANISM="Cylindrotheca closterium" /LENGTH=616 /DNA_ID=CAMNT_0000560771 /DNA_START=179 /DNA_END=2026 /DNA_ORIENTATION=+ /assembly_acc=CAM_ASM_000147
MTSSPSSGRAVAGSIASVILLWLQLGRTAAFQQMILPVNSLLSSIHQQRAPFHCPITTTCLQKTARSDETDSTQEESQIAYDWDEQFEELLSFKEQYGYCNFPRDGAPRKLTKEFPTLATFCHNQRLEYIRFRKNNYRRRMSLPMFDRQARFNRLKEIGFEFRDKLAAWYDKYYELVEFRRVNGHARVRKSNYGLYAWVLKQRFKRKGGTNGKKSLLSDAQIQLLDDIGFEWESTVHDHAWMAKYNELVDFRNKHGHLELQAGTLLYKWMSTQRSRRDGKRFLSPLSDEQIRLLDEIEFLWQPERFDKKWYAKYEELVRFQQTHGHCQPEASTSLYSWLSEQRRKFKESGLSKTQIKLLDEIDFPWKGYRRYWPEMYEKLLMHYNEHGHLQVKHEDGPSLYDWMGTQRQRYHGAGQALSDDQIEKLENINFCWSLNWKERTWHESYTEVVEFYKQNGHVQVTKKDNLGLYNWIQTQGKRYKEMKGHKPLSQEELELLESIDFSFFEDNQPRTTWNATYAALGEYRKEYDGHFPGHKDDPDLYRWMRQQRKRMRCAYGHAPLSDEQRSLLDSMEFPTLPSGREARAWYTKYDELVEYKNQHGHLLVNSKKDGPLCRW